MQPFPKCNSLLDSTLIGSMGSIRPDLIFLLQKQSCIPQKVGIEKCYLFFDVVVLVDAILLSLTLKIRTSVKIFDYNFYIFT